jgi:hypothetical protein
MKTLTELWTDLSDEKTPPDGSDGAGELGKHYLQDNYNINNGECQAFFNEFIPFKQSEPLPAFPLEALARICPASSEYINAAAEMIQAPIDLVGTVTLGMLEIACRGRYPVCLPNGHRERPCFYIAPIAPPSERKSGVIDTVSLPLVDFEIEYNGEHAAEIAQSESEFRLLQASITKAEREAINAKNSDDRMIAEHDIQKFNNKLVNFEAEKEMRLFSADVTPEKLSAMIKAQNEVFALVSAEGGGLFENIGRYCEKGGLEIYLNGYSGDRVCVDRKSSESIVINCPTLSIIAPCQPSVITDLFSDKKKSGRGLLSRILFVQCNSRVGGRKVTSKPIDDRIYTNYNNVCRNMLSASSKGDLRFDEGGFAVYTSFFDEIEPQLTPDVGDLSFMADWAGKLHGNMIRLAGLIHCIAAFEQGRNPLDSFINADEARAAVTLSRFFLAHAKAVYTEQEEPREISNARYLWRRIISLNSLSFNKSDLTRKVQNKVNFYNSDYSEALKRLVDNGYIRIDTFTTGRGRPTETIIINPEALK